MLNAKIKANEITEMVANFRRSAKKEKWKISN